MSAATYSLRARLLIVASAVLAAFLGLTGLTLDRAFRDSARAAVEERLRGAVYMLLGAAEADPRGGLSVPDLLPDPRLSTPESGFYARVGDALDIDVWRSPSMVGLEIPFPRSGDVGSARFDEVTGSAGRRYFALTYGVAWEFGPGHVEQYAIEVAENHASFDLQVREYRQALWSWLAALAVGLLAMQGAVLHWALAPLARVASQVRAIESGRQSELAGRYPVELLPLTTNLNGLIRSARAHLQRYRNALADLAHSLKTPLAVMRTTLEGDLGDPAVRRALHEQVQRIDQTVDYQLQRAAASGRRALAAPVAVRTLIERILASLAKVYAHKNIAFEVAIHPNVQFAADEGDLMEICGNLLDNACKWCRSRVRIEASGSSRGEGDTLFLSVEDDGPGIPAAASATVLLRGVRADPDTTGHGIGLAVVRELVEEIYAGRLELGTATGGGALVRVTIPAT
ncbi:MAG: hypothetical protein IT495_02335 [Gammaproteobacteria bacterium]|nr:hypothetical protein [Gammaproteobacteria bacterium]